jgi:hypothetical protein
MLESPALLRIFNLMHKEISMRRAAALPPHSATAAAAAAAAAVVRLEAQGACWLAHIGLHSQLRPLLFTQHF